MIAVSLPLWQHFERSKQCFTQHGFSCQRQFRGAASFALAKLLTQTCFALAKLLTQTCFALAKQSITTSGLVSHRASGSALN
jgi:hypothetical protein